MHKITIVLVAAMALGHATAPLSEDVSAGSYATIVKSVMDDTYGATNYDTKNACWIYAWKGDQGDSTTYCMRPGTPHAVEGVRGKMLYFPTVSVNDVSGNTPYRYAHVQPGLMGAFQIRLGGAQGWIYQAFDAGTDYGSAGDCGCADARFVTLSSHGDYGWLFTSGGTWQGTTVASYNIVTAIKGRIVDISKMPRLKEDDQDVTYAISVKEDPSAKGLYPLHVVKTSAGGKVDAFDVAFDAVHSRYVLPAGR